MTTLEAVRRQARPYPTHLLPKEGTALALFGAGFYGWNDVIHMAHLDIDCVDVDGLKLEQMAAIYDRFRAHEDDAWEFASANQGRKWDVVSVDPFFSHDAERAWDTLDLWVSLASRLVTLTVRHDTDLAPPEGWTSSYFPRNSKVGWMVLQPA